MKTYLVGGAIRDALLGLVVKDRDWVVVGASPQMMLDQGFQPVGRDFPVFLHPKTHEEYALARTERKTARGYHGFSFFTDEDVTLEQDLSRRDLTMNAIAQDADGNLIDPYHGRRDLALKVLRHVTLAFREDPVRILRVARFSARFPDFVVAPETMLLMRGMVANGEAAALVAERVWQELARGLMEAKPSRMFEVLAQCGLLPILLPEWANDAATMDAVDRAATRGHALAVRFACLQLPSDAFKAPADCLQLSQLLGREQAIHVNPHAMMQLLERSDAIRQPERFRQMLQAYECVNPDATTTPLTQALQAALSVATAPIAQKAVEDGLRNEQIGQRIAQARLKAIAASLASGDAPPLPKP